MTYAFGLSHSVECKALNDWNDIEPSSCSCGAYEHYLETGHCAWHDVPMTDDGECLWCKGEHQAWLARPAEGSLK
jgi:hypothetical protein